MLNTETEKVVQEIVQRLKHLQISRIILIGSAKGTARDDDSNPGLAVILSRPRRFDSYYQRLEMKSEIRKAVREINRTIPIDIFLFTHDEFAESRKTGGFLAREVQAKGDTVWEATSVPRASGTATGLRSGRGQERTRMEEPDGVKAAEAMLATRKRRVYEVAILLVVGVMVVNSLSRGPDLVTTYIYPITSLVFLATIPVMRRGRLALVERGLYAAACVAVGIGLIDLLFWSGSLESNSLEAALLPLTGAQYWAFALLLVFGFVVFERAVAQWVAASLFLLSLALAVAAMVFDEAQGAAHFSAVVYLLRMHVFLAAILLMVVLLSSLREQLHRAIERAELLDTRAMTDPLTGAANRFAAEERFATEVADAQRRSRPLSVAMVDIDHFKAINDTHGHDVGDAVLIAVTRTLDAHLRPRDMVARWGGEEFLLLLPEADLAAAIDIVERCRRAIEETRPHGIAVTATCGVADLVDDEPASGVVRRADVALYEGKQAGRNRVVGGDNPPVA